MTGFVFDDGATVAVDTRIQQAVITLLEPLLYTDGAVATARGPYLRTLEAIPQLPDEEFMQAQRTEYMRRMPGVLVYVGDGVRRDGFGGGSALFERTILLVVFSGIAGDPVDGRLDESAKYSQSTLDDPGVRVVRQHVFEHLHQKYLPIDGSGTITIERHMHLETRADWTTWGLVAHVLVDELACASDTRAATPLDAIQTKHDLDDKGVLTIQKEELQP